MILSKKAVLAQVDEELVARFELARLNRRDNDASEESLLDECTNEMIGEFVVDRVSISPKDMNRLLLAPTSSKPCDCTLYLPFVIIMILIDIAVLPFQTAPARRCRSWL